MEDLPNEILFLICQYLNPIHLVQLSLCSKFLKKITAQNCFWHKFCKSACERRQISWHNQKQNQLSYQKQYQILTQETSFRAKLIEVKFINEKNQKVDKTVIPKDFIHSLQFNREINFSSHPIISRTALSNKPDQFLEIKFARMNILSNLIIKRLINNKILYNIICKNLIYGPKKVELFSFHDGKITKINNNPEETIYLEPEEIILVVVKNIHGFFDHARIFTIIYGLIQEISN